jgi:DNA polymerase-3 subunit delta'
MELSDLPPVSLPMPWHNQNWTDLHGRLANNQLPHALLLVGGQHTGKSKFALGFSRMLLCSKPDGAHNCGLCHACQLSARGNHGDFLWVQPEESSRTIKIEQIRNVVKFANKTAGFGLRKIIVFSPTDSMNLNAFNALLKVLEEPPTNTYFILVCQRLYGIPQTIRSRGQVVRLVTPDSEACLLWLDQTTGSRQQSEKLLSTAGGMPLLAKQIFNADGAGELVAARQNLSEFLRGEFTMAETATAWSDIELGVFLEQLARELQRQLEAPTAAQLRSRQGRGVFQLLDETARILRAVHSGANPGRQLALEALLLQVRRELGTDPHGDKIRARRGAIEL